MTYIDKTLIEVGTSMSFRHFSPLEIVISQTMVHSETKEFAESVIYTYINSHVHLTVKLIWLVVNKRQITNANNLQNFKALVVYN